MKKFLFAAILMTLTLAAQADLALATQKNCMACHSVDKKVVGPSYKDVAAKYAGQLGAIDKLTVKVLKGGSGSWGPIPMPANAQLTESEAKKLISWIITLR